MVMGEFGLWSANIGPRAMGVSEESERWAVSGER